MALGRNTKRAGKFSPRIISSNFRARVCLQVPAHNSGMFSSWGNQQDLCTVNIIIEFKIVSIYEKTDDARAQKL
jgi:hypothetical protein